ncbi:energy-coupling factor transporter transmembrane protein EcfT [Adlercreutzia sp. ZJ138]|uniref:energy-coupling factor transporter transmembrane component T family protein n=1 Tax=Adlercreutzia sp. ZJ138 TaxID=2709405 RepID=UPI001F14B00F|nr:energy-coupling factor transporter transmembrane protein EcfT [Adlercreutzia sp. ZJ138]
MTVQRRTGEVVMGLSVQTYIPGSTPMHALDARVKLVLLAAYSVALFLIQTWLGLLCAFFLLAGAIALAKLPVSRIAGMLVPVYVIVLFTVLFNGFALDVSAATDRVVASGLAGVSAGVLADWQPVVLVGNFGWYPAGFARGCFYAVRIVLLVAASLVLCFTTTSTKLTDALNSFLKPLRSFGVPIDDAAMIFSLALRFIPVTAEEFERVRVAQLSRGAKFDVGALQEKLRAWQTVLIPLFVGMFRRADSLAHAMEARCYGMPGVARTSLHDSSIPLAHVAALIAGLLTCIVLALVF